MRFPKKSVLTFAVIAGMFAAWGQPARAACAATSSKFVSGTITGEDGLHVNVALGFDIVDKYGKKINMDGCPGGAAYSAYQWINKTVPATGVAPSSSTTGRWTLGNVPYNAAAVWIEAYPKQPGSGYTNTSKYGYAMRRAVGFWQTNVQVRMPVVCGQGGHTGTIEGPLKLKNGTPITPDNVFAWTELADTNTAIMGWGIADKSNGYYKLGVLEANQNYTVWYQYRGVTQVRNHVPVNSCGKTPVPVYF